MTFETGQVWHHNQNTLRHYTVEAVGRRCVALINAWGEKQALWNEDQAEFKRCFTLSPNHKPRVVDWEQYDIPHKP